MVSRHAALLNLASLLHHDPHAGDEVAGSGEFLPAPEWHSDEIRFETPLRWYLEARNTGGDDDFILRGSVEGEALMPCRRCLEPVAVTMRSEFVFSMAYRPGSAGLTVSYPDDESELLVFGRPEVDFAEMLTEIFVVDLPLTVLCDRGDACLDPALYHALASQAEQQPESPFAVLKDIDLD